MRTVLASMAPFLGGAEVAAERLALGLREAGHEVLMVLGKRGPVQERMERAGLCCLVCPMHLTDKWHWSRYARARARLRRLFQRYRPDVIHSNDLPTHQMVSDAARDLGIPRVCHHRFFFSGAAIDWLNKFGAERHLFVSRALMGAMCRESERLRESPSRVVHDGLPLPPVPGAEQRLLARARLGLPADRVLVLFAGQIIERKGVADLIEAWALLDPSIAAGADLLIVGDDLQGGGAYRAAMEERAARRGLPIRFAGFQRNVETWLVASDLIVVPSHEEPLGNATLEAMACARPVIGSRVGGIPEMLDHEQTGLLVPPRSPAALAAALTRLIADTPLRDAYGAAGRRRSEESFSLAAHTRGILQEYGAVLGADPTP